MEIKIELRRWEMLKLRSSVPSSYALSFFSCNQRKILDIVSRARLNPRVFIFVFIYFRVSSVLLILKVC